MGSKLNFLNLKNSNVILLFFSFLLIGCSSIYRLSDFSSPEKFYEDFNKSSYEKSVKIFLINDSSFIAEGGAKVVNDSLLFIPQNKKGRIILLKNKIKNVQFYYDKSNGTYSAKIVLNGGDIINEDNVELLPDSSISYEVYKYDSLPLNKIKKVYYKNNLLGTGSGFLIGSSSGFLVGLLIESILESHRDLTYTSPNPIYYVPVIGCITGIIWGGIEGYTYTYVFNL